MVDNGWITGELLDFDHGANTRRLLIPVVIVIPGHPQTI